MKMAILKMIGIMVCVCMLVCGFALPITSFAKGTGMRAEPRMTYITTYNTRLSISDEGTATVYGQVNGKTGVTYTYVKVTLQQSVSGVWVDVESWEASSDSRSATVAETYQVSRGTYRTVMTCSANGETKSQTSAERTY